MRKRVAGFPHWKNGGNSQKGGLQSCSHNSPAEGDSKAGDGCIVTVRGSRRDGWAAGTREGRGARRCTVASEVGAVGQLRADIDQTNGYSRAAISLVDHDSDVGVDFFNRNSTPNAQIPEKG
jgi:hypothetical protein